MKEVGLSAGRMGDLYVFNFPLSSPPTTTPPAATCNLISTVSSIRPTPHRHRYESNTTLHRLSRTHVNIHPPRKMSILPRNQLRRLHSDKTLIHSAFYSTLPQTHIPSSNSLSSFNSPTPHFWVLHKNPKAPILCPQSPVYSYSYSTRTYRGPIPRSLRKRINKRARAAAKPVLNEALFQKAISQLPPRFTQEELHDVIALQDDPLVCLELFNWASQQHRFKHNALTYHITIKKLGAAKMYEEMDGIVNQVLAIPSFAASEALYNSMIYYFTEARKLIRAVNIYKHMCGLRRLDCRPTIRTYNILFAALLSRGKNSYINHVYMETIRCLFKQMLNDGVEPDIFCLNSLIKGYVLSLHVNDALRIFHQIGVVYDNCQPNSYSYNYLIHGLCAQGRTINAREICDRMKKSGFVPSSKSYNSLVNALALEGEVDEAVKFLWEMAGNQRLADFITYRTVLDEVSRQKGNRDAFNVLEEFREKNLVDGHTYRKLVYELEER
ncbi:pentatricopeptide repeat-containing protein at2g27800 mitochondrial [Phtheirospermum japonicum]|uniref:Pentatricopeptide repeat-containing protein at2g27800 mitochondrial n=1 Tax=Phtheirospermum japonicum TaxID=374723 RepID=A0A830D715_9LAMI|nr:pentatricopeptide repeat-containing protein at2g27800 mitochondrial [Phtheirospermum japonicum]